MTSAPKKMTGCWNTEGLLRFKETLTLKHTDENVCVQQAQLITIAAIILKEK